MIPPRVICIGTSAGGVHALQLLFGAIDFKIEPAVVVVQHLPENAEIDLNLIFGRFVRGEVQEVRDKMPLTPGTFYFAPGGYHTLLEREGYFSLNRDEPVHFARPSIDVCFESAAWAYGPSAWGVLLTGANSDGVDGLSAIQRAGGLTLVQDPGEAEAPAMPLAAIERAKPNFILPLREIGKRLSEFRQVSR